MTKTLPALGELPSMPGFLGVSEKHRRPTVRVCSDCDALKHTTHAAIALGWEVTHGICVPCYNRQMGARGLD
jgi:hypothetical protein